MISWFDIAYATLEIIVIVYCFQKYLSSKKKPFQLLGLGFTCLTISDFLWVFTVLPWLTGILVLYGYIRLGLYAVFVFLAIRALQMLNSGNSKKENRYDT
ncbi:MAG: hypothetical protein OEX77_08725 [Candidatus Bathyarchaeota archaeon]|nr:hypothetical protein [Candidatus Bathyarchaeota archaeon]